MGIYQSMPYPHPQQRPKATTPQPRSSSQARSQGRAPVVVRKVPKAMAGRPFYGGWPQIVYHDPYVAQDRPVYSVPAAARHYHSQPDYLQGTGMSKEGCHGSNNHRHAYAYRPRPETIMPQSPVHEPASPQYPKPNVEQMSFRGAAQKLDSTLVRAISYFNSFYGEFRKETKGLGKYADKTLIDAVWESRIKFAERSPAAAAAVDESTSDTKTNNGGGFGNNNGNNRRRNGANGQFGGGNSAQDQNSNGRNVDNDVPTFNELVREVLTRYDSMCAANIPAPSKHCVSDLSLPLRRSESPSTSTKPDKMSDAQIHRAITMQRKVMQAEADFRPAVQGMVQNAKGVRAAIHEMSVLQAQLKTYRFAWMGDKDADSDDEEEGEDGGDGQDA